MTEPLPAGASTFDGLQREAGELDRLLQRGAPVTAFCHENPDADTVGAAVAMARAAAQLGIRSEVVSIDAIPPAYAYLTEGLTVNDRPTLEPGLAIVSDAASLDRIGSIAEQCRTWLSAATIVNIDHHVTNSGFGAVNLVDADAAASCEVVAWLLPRIRVKLDPAIASAILAGIIRDSQGFSTHSTSPSTLRAAADAVEAGAPMEEVYRASLLELRQQALGLWGRLLCDTQLDARGRIAWTLLTPRMTSETATEQHDAEGVAEFIGRAAGVEISLLFRDLGHRTRVSVRTAASADAAAIAGSFGGGGHRRRAGFTVAMPAELAIQHVLDACRRHLGS